MIVIEIDEKNIAITSRLESDDYKLKVNELDASKVPDFNENPFYKKQWDGQRWVEGATQEEINALKNIPRPHSELDELKKQQADLVFELMLKGVV